MHELIIKAREGNRNLLEHEAMMLFKHYGLPTPEYELVRSKEQAAAAAEEIGFPVVLKVVSQDIIHKTDVGGVKIGLSSKQDVEKAYEAVMDSVYKNVPSARIEGMLIVEQAQKGTECILGMVKDKQFGPALMFGLGGVFVEVLKDVSFRVLPLTQTDALEMIKDTKAYKVLSGVRGEPAKDIRALSEAILSLAKLVEQNPSIKEIDVNPVIVYEKGVKVLDARVII
ncbi:MAG: acetyl-CoA synthetase [Thermoanaerobacterales bacterium]|jgi:acyl-CoA synthetase (NDP forming)|nr:acetyl-CoA synthetase [Thermoanaerobacterales bacterium]